MQTETTLNHWVQIIEGLLPLVIMILGCALAASIVAVIILNILDRLRLLKQEAVFLELTPPAWTDKEPKATQHLFSVLHGLEGSRTALDKLLRRKVTFSLEVVSTREQGIRYVLRVPEQEVATFEQTVASYLPDAKLKRIDDYLPDHLESRRVRMVEVKQSGHFAYPLHTQVELWQNDPMAYLTGTMTKLQSGELVALQIVVSPAQVRESGVIAGKMLHNEEYLYQLGKSRVPGARGIFNTINNILFGIIDAIGDGFHGSSKYGRPTQDQHRQQVAMKIKPARTLSVFEQELAGSVHSKLSQPLFRTSIRAMVVVGDKQNENQRVKGVRDWLSSFNVPKYQALRPRTNFPMQFKSRYRMFAFTHRLPTIFARNSALFSASEVGDLYHFPHTETAKTENVVKSLSKTLAAPISLKSNPQLDVVLGRNHHHGSSTDIGLTAAEREKHIYIIGGTGNGKTTMMEYAIVQDIQNGKGVAVVDPHGDLSEKLLRYIPESRINDVIYFNPSDLGYPMGLNILELPEGLEGDELLDAKDFITESVISIMRKTFSNDDSGGHRIEYIMRNTVQTALTIEDATLFTVFDLLTDTRYRKRMIKKLEDEKLKNFWKNEFGKAGDFQRVKMAAGVTAKIGRYQFSASAERILSQPKSTINFEKVLDGKILICNFAKGLIGEDTSELFGISTLAQLQLAAYRRVKQDRSNRKPFYLYVDEFQNFATMSFVQMLSEARKYKVFLTMAEQSTSQQEEQRMVNTILANVGTVVCFRSGNPADEQVILPLFTPYLEPGEIANLPSYNFYARISAVLSQEPVSGETLLLGEPTTKDAAKRVIAASRANYAKKYKPKETPVLTPPKPKAAVAKSPVVKVERIATSNETINIPRKKPKNEKASVISQDTEAVPS